VFPLPIDLISTFLKHLEGGAPDEHGK
jgi:hypothetical protein